MLRRIINTVLGPYYRLRIYIENAYYLEAANNPKFGTLMTERLDSRILRLEVGGMFTMLILGGAFIAFAAWLGAPVGQTVKTFHFLWTEFEVDLTSFFLLAPFVYLGILLARITRARMVWNEFNTTWKGRSFNMPVAPAFL